MAEQGELLAKSAGDLLGSIRRSQNISIADVARNLKLQSEKIEFIETNEWQQFSPACARGYARQYGRLLGMPADQIENLVETIDCEVVPIQSAFLNDFSKPPKFIPYLRTLSYIAASVFVIIPLVWAYTHFAANLSEQDTSSMQIKLENKQFAQSDSGTVSSQNADASELPKHIQANMLPVFTPDEIFSQAQAVVLPPSGQLEIELSADSWLNITDASGKRLEYALKAGGQMYKYQGQPPYQMQIGRVTAARVWLDGKSIELPGVLSGGVANITVASDSSSTLN